MKGIYILTCEVNGKQYVGLDSNLPRRANEHLRGDSRCTAISAAIAKHGVDAFTVEIIRYPNVPYQILCWFERSHIAERNSKAPNGYNLTDGGEGSIGYKHTVESRQKISRAKRGVHTGKSPMLGKKHTAESRAKMSEKQQGQNNGMFGKKHTIETRQKISQANSGKTRTTDTRRKMSEKRRGKNNNFYGKTHTTDARRKMSETHRGKTISDEQRRKLSKSVKRAKYKQKKEYQEKVGQGTLF